MWPVVVLGLLTAIFAWIWYGGSGDAKEPQDPEQKQEPQPESVQPDEQSPLPAADEPGEQGAPSLETQERNPDVFQAKGSGLCNAECLNSGHAADTTKITQDTLKEHPTDLPRKGELHADLKEHPTDLPREELLQANIQEHPTELPREEELHTDLKEHPTDLPVKGELHTDIKEHPIDIPRKEELQTDINEHPTDLPREEELHTDLNKHPTDLPKEEELHTDLNEHPTDLPREEELHTDLNKHPTDLPKEEELHTDLNEHPTDLPREEELQDYALNEDDQANIQEQPTCVLEDHLLVRTTTAENHSEIPSKNDEVDGGPCDIQEARERPDTGGQVYPPLKQEPEEEPPHTDVGTAALQANGEDLCPAEEPGAQKLLGDTCHGDLSPQENGGQDGVCANEGKRMADNAADRPLENSLFVKENVKERSNEDLFLEMVNKSIEDAYAVVADQLKQESIEKCDTKRDASTSLQDQNSAPEGLSNVQKLGTGPESPPVDVSNEDKEMASFGSSTADEKTPVGGPPETGVHDPDHQKTRKVATIHPMSQNVNFAFKVHYITHSDSQLIAITGDHEKLGKWETYVPLTSGNGGFWSHSIALPADTNLAWKLVMVENGKIRRWEECNNRCLKTSHEDIENQLFWGYP